MVNKALKGPCLLADQGEITQSDIEDHRGIQVRYSPKNPSFVDCENNAVDEKCLREYRTFFCIPSDVVFRLTRENAAWNPPHGCVAIYGFMFYCGVTLPIPGFITRFLSSVKCAPMQLTPNAYRNLIGLYCLWRDLNFGEPSVNEIKHCLILRKSINEIGSYYLGSYHPSRWMPIGEDGKRMEGRLDLPIKEDVPKKNGNTKVEYSILDWLDSHFSLFSGTYTDQPKLTKKETDRVSQVVQTAMDSRNFKTLVTAEKLKTFGLIPALINDRNHILDLDPILGKTLRALKSVKVVSKKDAKATERQGIVLPDYPEVADGLDFPMPTPNVVTASSHVTTPIPKTKVGGPPRGIPLQTKKGNSELTGSEPIDSVFRDLGPLPEQRVSKNVKTDPPPILQDSDFPIFPDQSLDRNVPRPSASLSGFFGGEGSTRPKPAAATGPSLPDPDPLDPSVALRWVMSGELSFGPTGDFESFIKDDLTDQYQRSLHFMTIFLRKCDLVAKDRDKLADQVKNLAEERTKLLADNAKLQTSHEKDLAAEQKKNEEGGRRIAALEKQRDSFNFRLREYERDFETAKTELGVRAISLFKRSPAFEAFAHKEFVKGVDACKTLVRSMEYPSVADQIDESMWLNLQEAEQDLNKQVSRWEFDKKRKKMPLLDVHTDLEARVVCVRERSSSGANEVFPFPGLL
ncbi:hypothetical protein LWI29_018741 [Acer saccharum]|uniref:Uncharacterized protein n=1 Tax=Acer saccharum TaxID=4024 RepID=A0AA39SR52_ACESA|nr:hypothetical protein LWI29_018741 [Acer saccharum]